MQEAPPDAAAIVHQARKLVGDSQRAFARRMGSAQSLICKYERGDVSPPAAVLIHCMNLLRVGAGDMSAEELAVLVKTQLSGARMASARQAIAHLIRCLPSEPQKRGTR